MSVNTEETLEYPDEAGLMILPWVCLFPGAMMPLISTSAVCRPLLSAYPFQSIASRMITVT